MFPQRSDLNTCPLGFVNPVNAFAGTGPGESDSTGIEISKSANGASIVRSIKFSFVGLLGSPKRAVVKLVNIKSRLVVIMVALRQLADGAPNASPTSAWRGEIQALRLAEF